MKERSKPTQLYVTVMFIFGFLTAFNMFLSIGEPGWMALIVSGLATGAIGGTVALATLKYYGNAEGRELSGRARRKMAFTVGMVFGAALTPAVAMVNAADGGFLFMVGLIVGSGGSDRARRMLRGWMSMRTDPQGDHADNPEDEHAFRMLKFAFDSRREELAAGAMMMLGFVLSAGVVLGAYAGFLAIMGR